MNLAAFQAEFSLQTGGGMKRISNKQPMAGLWLALCLLAVISLTSLAVLRKYHEDNLWIRHAGVVLLHLHNTLSLLQDAETGQRGYLLTGQDRYLSPYRKAVRGLDDNLRTLSVLAQNTPRQRRQLARLQALSQNKLAELRRTIDLRRERGANAALQVVLAGKGKAIMDALRATLGDMETEEQARLEQQRQQAESTARLTTLVVVGGSLFLFALVAVSTLSIQRSFTARKKAEDWLTTTLQSIGDGMIATDREGCITLLNPVAEGLTGWNQAEVAGKDCREVFRIVNEETRREVESPVTKVIREGTIVGLANHTILLAKDGTERPIDDSGAPIRDRDGNLLGVVLVFRDITERKRHEHVQQFLAESGKALAVSLDYETTLANVAKLAVPNLADWCAVHVVEEDGGVLPLAVAHTDPEKLRWAEEWRQKFPYEPDAPRGVPQVLRTGRPEFYPDIPDSMLAALDDERRAIIRQIGFTSAIIAPMAIRGRTLGAITFVSAESGRRYTEADLAVAEDLALSAAMAVDNARLYRAAQQEIATRRQREADIEALNARLKRTMAETHHRVKNNLQVISALIEMQIMQYEETVPCSELTRLAKHIGGLAAIHDLLTQAAKSDAEMDYLSTETALQKLLPMVQASYPDRRIRFAAQDVRLPVREGTSLAILVNELISNAAKHGAGEIELTLALQGDRACLEVRDSGPGFPEGFAARTAANTGLELIESIVRVDLRGEIAYENRVEGGARVVVTFPVSQHP